MCSPGTTTCDGEFATKMCNSGGTDWETPVSCLNATTCSDDACRGSVCAVGSSKCDDDMLDPTEALRESQNPDGGAEWDPPFTEIYSCADDGNSWIPDTCEADSICIQAGADRDAVNTYREEMAAYTLELEEGNPGAAAPTPPALTGMLSASCKVQQDCPLGTKPAKADVAADAFFARVDDMRGCGIGTYEGADDKSNYGNYYRCAGIAPYSLVQPVVTPCEGITRCEYSVAACLDTECYIFGETACQDENQYTACEFFVWDDPISCPNTGDGGTTPGVCETVGTYPDRTVLCNGEGLNE